MRKYIENGHHSAWHTKCLMIMTMGIIGVEYSYTCKRYMQWTPQVYVIISPEVNSKGISLSAYQGPNALSLSTCY